MPLPIYQPRRPDYQGMVSRGLEGLGGAISDYQASEEARKEKKHQQLKESAPSPIADIVMRVINGEASIDDAVTEHLVNEHLERPSLQRQSSPGPWAAGYDQGPDQGPMIPYSEPARGGRLPSGPLADLNPQGDGPGPQITNKNLPEYLKIAGLVSSERNRAAMADYRADTLGLNRDKFGFQVSKYDEEAALRDAKMNYMNALAARQPIAIQQAEERLKLAWANAQMRQKGLGLQERSLDVKEANEYLKQTGETAWAVPAIDNILNKARMYPGMVPPMEDYSKRRTAEILNQVPVVGKMAGAMLTKSADQDLTQPQRDFRRQVQLAITPFRKLIVGSQITEGEHAIINEIAGGQVSIEDTIAGLTALRQLMATRQTRAGQAYPNAAQQIGRPNPNQALPPLGSGQSNDPYGIGALNQTPELDWLNGP